MKKKNAGALLFDGYADWEIGYILPELRRLCGLEVVTVGFSDSPVVSMGGLKVIPDTVVSKVDPEDFLIFILPGGHMWEQGYPVAEIETLLHRFERAHVPIAAICAATTAVARAGLLRGRKHTSNSRTYLAQKVPAYAENANYVDALAVRDQRMITACGLGSIEFTMEIFHEIGLMSEELKTMWFNAIKHGIYPENIEHGA